MKTEPTRIAALYPQTGIPQIASKDFDLSSVNYFSSLLERYKYGKDLDLLLDPSRGFKVVYKGGEKPAVLLENYFHCDAYKGICGEVAHAYGMQLLSNPEVREKYDVVVVAGSVADVFSGGHAFLLVAPKKLNIRDALNKDRNKFPEGSILIDPSLGTMGDACTLGGYKLDGFVKYTEAHDFSSHCELELKPNNFNPMVIGFLKDYIPISDSKDKNQMLYLTFNTDSTNKIVSVDLIAHDPKTDETQTIDLEKFQDSSMQVRNLKKLLEKVRCDSRSSVA